ncbi:MAG: hypothetical protein AAGA54_20555 [Myxococcota bacterium]
MERSVQTQSFQTRFGTIEDFVQVLVARDDTCVTDDPCPYPPDHRFLLNVHDLDRGTIRVRHYTRDSEAASPVLHIEGRPSPTGTVLACRFLDPSAPFVPQRQIDEARAQEQRDDEEFLQLDD